MKKNRILLISLILCFILFNLSFVSTVSALPLNWVALDDFEDYIMDATSGTGETDISWELVSGSDGHIRYSADKRIVTGRYSSLDTHYFNVDNDYIWINCSSNHSGYYFEFYGFCSSTYHNEYYYQYLNWYNETVSSLPLIKLKISCYANGGSYNKIQYHNGNTWVNILTGLDRPANYYFSWQFLTDNMLQYKVYDMSWNLVKSVYGTSYNTSVVGKENYSCNNCLIINGGGDYYVGANYGWIDNYGYIEEDIYGEDTYPELMGCIVTTYYNGNWFNGIPQICLGSTVAFNFDSIGETGCRMCISMCTDTETLLWVCSLEQEYNLYYTFNEINTYTITVVDPIYYPDGYEMEVNFTVLACGEQDYDATFGNFYAEFYTDGSPCFYIDNEHPAIIYNFNDSVNFSTVDGKYIVDVYQEYPLNNTRVYTRTFNHGDKNTYLVLEGVNLYHMFNYEIRVYNVTKESTGYTRNSLIYTSAVMVPCADIDEDGIPDPFDEDVDTGGETDVSSDNVFHEYGMIVGLAVCFGIGVLLLYLTGEPITFFGGFGVTCFFLSNETMGSIQLLPSNFGIGLIVVMVIIGVIVWFST